MILRFATTVALVSFALPTVAQDNTIEQVLVSANRSPQDGARVPLAWSAVDASELQLTGQIHINELMQRVPGAWISRGNGQESLTALRSPVLTGAGSCGAFYMAFDSISLRAPGFCNVNQLFDTNTEQAGRIEVLKGPATALYGSGAMHGVINVLSADATQQPPGQSLGLEAGPDDYYRAKYQLAQQWGEHSLSLRANGSTDGGYKDDSGYDQQKLTLRYDYRGAQWDITTALQASNLNQETAGFIQGFEAYEDEDLKDTNPNPEAYRDARAVLAYVSASTLLGEQHRLTLTPYLRDNEMEFLMHFVPWQPVETNQHQSVGFRAQLDSTLGNWRWINGAELDYTDGELQEIQGAPFPSPNFPVGVHYDYQVDALTSALFSQLNGTVAERWEVSLGARFEYNRYDYDNRSTDGSACGPEASACRFFRPADRRDSFDDWSLNAGASYALTDQHRLYTRVAKGFRAPQTAELYRLQAGQAVADLDSEEIESVELGARGRFGNDLNYDVAVYHMRKDEVIFQDADRQNVSGAATEHRGLELSLDYQFADDWSLGADFSWARHRYDSRIELLGSRTDIKGNDIDTTPRRFGSARLSWDMSSVLARPATSELEWVYMGRYDLEPDNAHTYDGHSLVNLRVQAELSAHWSAAVRLTNLLDEDYAERADFGFGEYRYFVGQPRGAYVELSYRFGG
jgi:outer membrane receptor protein involved in Fe transport